MKYWEGGYGALAAAICIQAAHDYAYYMRESNHIHKGNTIAKYQEEMKKIEDFFLTDDVVALAGIDGEMIIETIKKEVKRRMENERV